ncbi:MAG: hypothetical protein KatS3mg003_1319 [Candidatus Nitrosocaldaceae archaeon]|nr:MAG: hypothetical protein KatS3mg003_1319 [Candidatus Nitrosocaldaceae archaeon]
MLFVGQKGIIKCLKLYPVMPLPKIEERTLYPPIIEYLKKIGFKAIGETSLSKKQPDILFSTDSIKFVVEVKIGKPDIGLKATAQAYDYANRWNTRNVVVLIYPEKYKNQTILDMYKVKDVALVKRDDKYWEKLKTYGLEIAYPFPWNDHINKNIIDQNIYIVIPRKIRLNSPNTYAIAIYSEVGLKAAGPSLWYIKTHKHRAKLLTIYLNSILTILEILLFKSETLGAGYFELMKDDWKLFHIIDVKSLSKENIEDLLTLFDRIKDIEFPSILEQLENRFEYRVELDKTILKILGFTNREINELLPKIYDAIVNELKIMKNAR